jgi:GntR family transcriptional repressor for pyruvate dehydrogenase complex
VSLAESAASATGPIEPIKKRRLVDSVVDALTEAIVSGRFRTGSALPSERELAAMLGVNRTTLRQAISRIEQAGLVEVVQGRGTIVRDPAQNPDPALLGKMLPYAGPELVDEVFELREAVLATMAQLAARRARKTDLVELRSLAAEIGKAESPERCQLVERQWFDRLAAATRNRALVLLLRWVWKAYEQIADMLTPAFADPARVCAELSRAADALESRDAVLAAEAVRLYARTSARRMKRALFSTSAGASRRAPS